MDMRIPHLNIISYSARVKPSEILSLSTEIGRRMVARGTRLYRTVRHVEPSTANLRTKILDFRRLDSSRILISRGGIPRPIWNFPESLAVRAGLPGANPFKLRSELRTDVSATCLDGRCEDCPVSVRSESVRKAALRRVS